MNKLQLLAFGAAAALTTGGFVATATPAFAGSQVVVRGADVPLRLVRFSDLDLTQKSGQKLLNRRVGTAVHDVCDGSASYATFQSEGFCKTAAWNRARPQIARAIDNAHRLAANGLKATGVEAAIAI